MAAQLKLTNKKRINPPKIMAREKTMCVHKTENTMKKRRLLCPMQCCALLCVRGRDNQLISGRWRLMAHLRANGNRLLRSTSKRRAVNFSPFFPWRMLRIYGPGINARLCDGPALKPPLTFYYNRFMLTYYTYSNAYDNDAFFLSTRHLSTK